MVVVQSEKREQIQEIFKGVGSSEIGDLLSEERRIYKWHLDFYLNGRIMVPHTEARDTECKAGLSGKMTILNLEMMSTGDQPPKITTFHYLWSSVTLNSTALATGYSHLWLKNWACPGEICLTVINT